MNEAETRAEYIDPALKAAGWGVVEGSRIRREYPITLGPHGGSWRRGKPLTADYVLDYRNTKLAVIEAKAWDEELTEGVAQAKNYAGKLAVRHTYSTNGRGIYAIDMETGKEGEMRHYPTPDELWNMTFAVANAGETALPPSRSRTRAATSQPRYYQDIAIARVLEAIAAEPAHPAYAGHRHGQDLHRLPNRVETVSEPLEPEPGTARRPRILFLADRNILADQAYNAFSPSPKTRWCGLSRRTSARRARCRRTAACCSPSSRPS